MMDATVSLLKSRLLPHADSASHGSGGPEDLSDAPIGKGFQKYINQFLRKHKAKPLNLGEPHPVSGRFR